MGVWYPAAWMGTRWLGFSFLGPLALFGVLALLFSRVVDLTPEVSPNFFFAKGDRAVEETTWIGEKFPGSNEMLVVAMGSTCCATSSSRANALEPNTSAFTVSVLTKMKCSSFNVLPLSGISMTSKRAESRRDACAARPLLRLASAAR